MAPDSPTFVLLLFLRGGVIKSYKQAWSLATKLGNFAEQYAFLG